MTFIDTVPEAEASGAVAELYENDRATQGQIRNLARAMSVAPDVNAAWVQLNATVKARMDLRRYELATLAAARRLRSSYCSLAHGSILLREFLDGETLTAVALDHHDAGLDEVDVAVMDLADKVVSDATSVTQADVDGLRSLGLSDSEVFDVVATAALRCFFSKLLDGLGVQPDATFADLEPQLRDALTVGRPIAETR
jgi:uncharacterized peroxidase-related enzyme